MLKTACLKTLTQMAVDRITYMRTHRVVFVCLFVCLYFLIPIGSSISFLQPGKFHTFDFDLRQEMMKQIR